MPIHQTLRGAHVPVHIFTDDIDAQALRQLHNIASLPIVHPHVAACPTCMPASALPSAA
jgi:tRNA-splicing ligase RtcB